MKSSICTLPAGALALQTTSFPLSEDQYIATAVQAVISVNCVGNEAGLHDCSWTETNIDTNDNCAIDAVAEVVCQGMLLHSLELLP